MTITSNLSGSAKRALRAAAHHLDPVVMIGDKGLTAAVLHEVDIALAAHALIKVRVASDDREQRVAFMNDICAKLACESVQHLGKLLVLWRNKEGDDGVMSDDEAAEVAAPAARARGPRKKLANDAAAGFRRPDASDPRPREGRTYGGRGDAAGAAPRTGGYGRAREGDAPAPRGRGGYGAGDGFAKPTGGFSKPAGDRYAAPPTRNPDGTFDNRRFRRGGDAPAPDTRPPREGWAPRNRRGEGRNDAGNAGGFAGRARDDAAGGAAGGFDNRPPRGGAAGGFDNRPPRGGAADGGYSRGAPAGRTPAGGARASAGGGRWGARDGAPAPRSRGPAGGGASAAPKPRARRRLG
jgi:RNA-binding protein